ncbi:cholinesterase-like [Artemia franciscana]|uniref:Carboxylesterase type B domain-containing protein n=1 Tax=Artemia franciscana TaxID=6661 RepID=A0AA88HZN9_ARTSF|nr:hypothetical protein QYM36_009545 [Artemia franciscana]
MNQSFFLFLLVPVLCFCNDEATVSVPGFGQIIGVKYPSSKRGFVYGFLGIPYAKQPVGERRFRPPEPLPYQNTTWIASKFMPACPQPVNGVEKAIKEDCLYVNVWIPELPGVRNYPVVVFIEGQLFIYGDVSRYPGEDLAADGLVVVSFNYRTNIFGFFGLNTPEYPGNLGLHDQIRVLQWVKENIARFGGDPSRVTLIGHGAGAASVTVHMVSPRSQDLYERAIIMSGNVLAPWATSDQVKVASEFVAQMLGCDLDTNEMMKCLQGKSVKEIVLAFERHYKEGNITDLFAPTIDNFLPTDKAILPKDPQIYLQRGDFKKRPVIAGISDIEGKKMLELLKLHRKRSFEELENYFLTASVPTIAAEYKFKDALPFVYRAIRYHYSDKAVYGDKLSLEKEMSRFYSDSCFKGPHHVLLQYLKSKTTVYAYEYTSRTTEEELTTVRSSSYTPELLFLFGLVAFRLETTRSFSRAEEQLSDTIKKLVQEFAQGGNPTPSPYDNPQWEAFGTNSKLYPFGVVEAGQASANLTTYQSYEVSFWTTYLYSLEKLARGEEEALNPGGTYDPGRYYKDPTEPYQSIMWVLLVTVVVLLAAFILGMASMRQRHH